MYPHLAHAESNIKITSKESGAKQAARHWRAKAPPPPPRPRRLIKDAAGVRTRNIEWSQDIGNDICTQSYDDMARRISLTDSDSRLRSYLFLITPKFRESHAKLQKKAH